jgi:hypothetical protein
MQRTLAWIATFAICVLATMPARAAQLAFVSVAGSAAKADPPVAIEPIAQKLGWTFKRTADGAILDDGTGAQTLRVGSRFVREDGTDVQLFDQPASDRNGHIELAISDAATLFHLSVQRDGPGFVLVTPPEDDVDIREIPRPPAPSPHRCTRRNPKRSARRRSLPEMRARSRCRSSSTATTASIKRTSAVMPVSCAARYRRTAARR